MAHGRSLELAKIQPVDRVHLPMPRSLRASIREKVRAVPYATVASPDDRKARRRARNRIARASRKVNRQ